MTAEDYPLEANLAKSDNRVRLEPGLMEDPSNIRFNNILYLGQYFPSFIPNALVPKDEVFAEMDMHGGSPVQAIKGKNWYELIDDESTRLEEHIRIAIESILQVAEVWERTGIFLDDRDTVNILREDGSGQIFQIDLLEIYDSFADYPSSLINNNITPSERQLRLQKNRTAIESKIRGAAIGFILDILGTLRHVAKKGAGIQGNEAKNLINRINGVCRKLSSGKFSEATFAEIFQAGLEALQR